MLPESTGTLGKWRLVRTVATELAGSWYCSLVHTVEAHTLRHTKQAHTEEARH